MKLHLAYTLGFWAAIELSLLSVLLGGEFHEIYWFSLCIPLIVIPMRTAGVHVSPFTGLITSLGVLGFAASILIERGMGAALLGGAVFLMGMLLVRLLTGNSLRDDLQALLLSLFLVFSGSVLHTEVTFGFILIAYSLAAVWALVVRQLVLSAHREAQRVGGAALEASLVRRDIATPQFFGVIVAVAMILIASTSILFFLFPRVGFQGLGFFSSRQGELPSSVSLFGGPVKVQGGEAVIARLEGISEDEFKKGLYLRGPVYSHMTSAGFEKIRITARGGDFRQAKFSLPLDKEIHEYEVSLQPVSPDVIPTLGIVRGLQIQSGGVGIGESNMKVAGMMPDGQLVPRRPIRQPIRYKVRGNIDRPKRLALGGERVSLSESERAFLTDVYLQLPPDLDERIGEFAKSFSKGSNSVLETVGRVRFYLKNNFEYTLDRPNGTHEDPLAAFLFDDRRGHCEYFAAAFVVLLRQLGIPSRVVGGYQGGYWDTDWGGVIFRGKNAHVWVEWLHPEYGWRVDDATPVSERGPLYLSAFGRLYERVGRWWDDRILAFGLIDQINFAQTTAMTFRRIDWSWIRNLGRREYLGVGVGLGVLVFVGLWGFWYRRRKILSAHQRLGLELQRGIEGLIGAPLPVAKSIGEALPSVEKHLSSEDFRMLRRMIKDYEQSRFGPKELDPMDIRDSLKKIRLISKS